MLKRFCFSNGYRISGIYSDIASGISFEKRKVFFSLLDEVLDGRVEKVVITYKDRLSRVGFDLFYHLFKKLLLNEAVQQKESEKNKGGAGK